MHKEFMENEDLSARRDRRDGGRFDKDSCR